MTIKRSSFFRFSYLMIFFLAFSCNSEEEEVEEKSFEEQYPVEEGQRVEYNNEYLKVIDEDDEEESRPKRLINENAMLNLGTVEFSWGEDTKKFNDFRKKGTDMHFYKKGVRLRMNDMYDFKINLQLNHQKSPFGTVGQSFKPDDCENNCFELELEDSWEIGELILKPVSGSLKVNELKPSGNKIDIHFSGKAVNEINEVKKDFELKIDMRVEEVTSSVNPNA